MRTHDRQEINRNQATAQLQSAFAIPCVALHALFVSHDTRFSVSLDTYDVYF